MTFDSSKRFLPPIVFCHPRQEKAYRAALPSVEVIVTARLPNRFRIQTNRGAAEELNRETDPQKIISLRPSALQR